MDEIASFGIASLGITSPGILHWEIASTPVEPDLIFGWNPSGIPKLMCVGVREARAQTEWIPNKHAHKTSGFQDGRPLYIR
jgi:hypothetical protein